MLDVWYSLSPPEGPFYLDDDEQSRHQRFLCARTAHTFAHAHTLKRCALSHRHPQHPPMSWRFETGPVGKPRVRAPQPTEFNLSHSGTAVAVAVADQAVGVDIECHRPLDDGPAVAGTVFHPRELQWLDSQAAFFPAFYQLWTLKEAVLKAMGKGFFQTPESLCWEDLSPSLSSPPSLAPLYTLEHEGRRWFARHLPLPGASLAVASEQASALQALSLRELAERHGHCLVERTALAVHGEAVRYGR